MNRDQPALDDLASFARIEMDANDSDPWGGMFKSLHELGALDYTETLWLVKGYNTYDDFNSAWRFTRRWESPFAWATAADGQDAADYWCTTERRNLRGGRVIQHLSSFVAHVQHDQEAWLRVGLVGDDPQINFKAFQPYLRQIWGVGRQSAFEWSEHLAKALGWPLEAVDAELWESEGPRRSLQRLYGNPSPDLNWLNDAALDAKTFLKDEGVDVVWEDFETLICNFNTMREGRYYPGRHLAGLREELDQCPTADKAVLDAAWERTVPPGWRDIRPGTDKGKGRVYRDSGRMLDAP
jgi:hypothetical protein